MNLPALCEPGPPLTKQQATRYSRHLLLPEIGEEGQRRLLNARVLVIGAGGLGAPVLLYLAAAGVGTLGIVDDDVVDASNLQRQIIHRHEAVGLGKAASAAAAVRASNPETRVIEYPVRLTGENAAEILAGWDLVIDGADNFATRYLVADHAQRGNLPVLWAAILRFDAQISLFWANPPGGWDGVTLRDLFPAEPPVEVDNCSTAGVLGALCGQVGSTMAAEAVKLIVGIGESLLGRVLVLDTLNANWREVPLRARKAGRGTASSPGVDTKTGGDKRTAGKTIKATCSAANGAGFGSGRNRAGDVALIDGSQLRERLAARERGEQRFNLVDVRDEEEVRRGTITGAIHIPLVELLTEVGRSRLDPELDLVLYCQVSPRAKLAARHLAEHGFEAVTVLDGGMSKWPK